MLQKDVFNLLSDMKKIKARKLSFVTNQIQTLVRCVRNEKTEDELNYLWKMFKKFYIKNISRKNPYFLLGINHFIVDISLILEIKRKYFNSDDDLSENIESTSDLYMVKFFEILIELCNKCYLENKIQENQIIEIFGSFNNLAISYLKEAELQMGKDVLKPYTFFSIMKIVFEEWYGTYAENPVNCIEKYSSKEEIEEEKEEADSDTTKTNETEEEVLNE